MTTEDKNFKDGKPTPTSEENPNENPNDPVEGTEDDPQDADFEKELERLESEEGQPSKPAQKPHRSELERATFAAKSTIKRIKELGGDPSAILADEDDNESEPEKPAVDTSKFVTKVDLARTEATRLAKSPTELRLMMWYVENKGMSVEDAHFMANKGRIKKTLSEVSRTQGAKPAGAGGGPGQRTKDEVDAPDLPEIDKRRLAASGMIYDPIKKAYVGTRTQYRFDETSKQWVNERIQKKS